MSRILAFIENDMYVRNFITSAAFDLLMPDAEFGICISTAVTKLKSSIPPEKIVGAYERIDENISLVYRFNKLSMRALRKKSPTFDIKVKTRWMGGYSVQDEILSSTLSFNLITKRWLIRKFRNNPTIEKIIMEYKPDLIIFPITGVESTGVELINLSQKYGFKTLFVINGWDNLSSKGIFPLLPDYLGVWGLQSALDAVNIQGMPFHRVIMLGCSRYESYFIPGNADVKLFPNPYILFAGVTTPCDEITPLGILDQILEDLGNTDIKIVYRPHPWREKRNCFDTFEPASYKHVILDPQIANNYYGEKRNGTESSSSQNFPALTYYPSLVSHALFAISPMSSMTLEAALFDVPCLVLAYDDGYHPISGSLQAKYKHFEGGEEVPGWFFVRDSDEMKSTFRMLVERFRNDPLFKGAFRPALSSATRIYLHQDGRSYAKRLYEAAQLILAPLKLKGGSAL